MATTDNMQDIDDLEDGEIESDEEHQDEEAAQPIAPSESPTKFTPIQTEPTDKEEEEMMLPKKPESKREKKRSKEHHSKSEHKSQKKDKSRKFLLPTPGGDDYAGSIEKAILLALNKGSDNPDEETEIKRSDSGVYDLESKRKHKKRKKHDEKESSRKRKKREETREERGAKGDDEMDEDEMMCIRGASPVHHQQSGSMEEPREYEKYHSGEEYESEDSVERGGRGGGGGGAGRGRGSGRRPERARGRPRRQDMHPQQDPDGVCLFYMQGKCFKGDDCTFSHDAQPPRKMELCKFYLMDCCAKRDKCLYLHSDFPCKYYHTGLKCNNKDDCKFAHGKPLTESFKNILLKHIESAPKEILGDFPRLNRDSAAMMVNMTQNKLIQQYSPNLPNNKEKGIPSLFDLNVAKPMGYEENPHANVDSAHHVDKGKNSKVRQSRWCDSPAPMVSMLNTPNPNSDSATQNILSIQNLNGVLTPHQISELTRLGIENLNQLSQLTITQLIKLGLTMNQVNEIQLNTMSIQNLGLIQNQSSKPNAFLNNVKMNKDLDMRVSPILSDMKPVPSKMEVLGQDVDMRYQSNRMLPAPLGDKDSRIEGSMQSDPRRHKISIDIDQYTKDALKFSRFEKENIANSENEISKENQINSLKQTSDNKIDLDIDHRVIKYVQDATVANVRLSNDENDEARTESDTDSRVSSVPGKTQESYFQKKHLQKTRRATTDDEDDNLQIDEKWYSSDEERNEKPSPKIKSPPQTNQPKPYVPDLSSDSMEPCTVITKLGDLSKIDISAEVTKLLTSIKNNTTPEPTTETDKKIVTQARSRDPRNIKKSPERKNSTESLKKANPRQGFVSIYNCIEGGSSDGRKRIDIDLRPIKDIDFRMPTFGDTDLRQTPGSGDVDLRLGLPFKPIPNYTPASEIDGSISSHPPIVFKLNIVDVPTPDYTDIKNSTPESQAASDPRLRKIFRLSTEENPLDSNEKATKLPTSVRVDPRKRIQESTEKPAPKPNPIDLQSTIQTSNWYKELSSNQKILVNQQLASVTASLKKFHQDNTPGKMFDLSEIKSNNVLNKIFINLGIMLNEKGEFLPMKLPEVPGALQTMGFNQTDNFLGGNMPIMMDPSAMMSMNSLPPNLGPSPMGSMGGMSNFDMRFQGGDPRGAPGLLGMAPNMPHNFDNGNFNGMPNFANDNSSRIPNFNNESNNRIGNFGNDNFNGNFDNANAFNGSGGNMNKFQGDNYDDNYYRNQKNDYKYRGGRGNDRWRGGGGRGRDRRGGGNWKGDRR